MGRPDFLIVGAMKAGTTSLAAWLGAHPHVFMAAGKELHFFDQEWDLGVDHYFDRLGTAPPGVLVGEATPSYMVRPIFIERMASVVPDAKLIVVLRNPVDRAWSQYNHSVERGDEARSFADVVRHELDTDPSDWRTSGMCLARGRYVEQLRNLSARFERERIHVGLFDELVQAPVAFFAATCRFLGVDDGVRPPIVGEVFNPRATVRHTPLAYLLRSGTLLDRLPSRLQRRARAMSEARPENEPLPGEMRSMLIEYFRPHNGALAEWLGVDLSEWSR